MDKATKKNRAIVFTVLIIAVLISGGMLFLLLPVQTDLQTCIDSTVLIEIDGRHTGSGFVAKVSDKEMLIITARHVVDRKGDYAVLFRCGTRRSVQAIRISESSDCAMLQVRKTGLKPLTLITKIRVGQPIIVIGSPIDQAYFNYITRGIVSKLNVQEDWLSCNPVVMIDAAANPGNSGGPVFDLKGRVVGIVIAKYVYNCGMNFITPSIDIITLLEEYGDEGENHAGRYEEDKKWFTEEY